MTCNRLVRHFSFWNAGRRDLRPWSFATPLEMELELATPLEMELAGPQGHLLLLAGVV